MKLGKRIVFKDSKIPLSCTYPVRYVEFKKGEEIFVSFGIKKDGNYTVNKKGIFKAKKIRGISKLTKKMTYREAIKENKKLT